MIMLAYSAMKKHRERHTGILDVKTGDNFGFAFGDVERCAIGLGDTGDKIDQKDWQQGQPEPMRDAAFL